MSTSDEHFLERRNRRSATRVALVVLAMFGFGYALVPLYNVFCEITGLNGKTGVAQADSIDGTVDTGRTVKVEFLGTVNSALPWEFVPSLPSVEVHPGGLYEARFVAVNRASFATAGRAVPSVAPNTASRYFDKTQCFCFDEQTLAAAEEREMVVRFVVRRGLPKEVRTITLSYTFFSVPQTVSRDEKQTSPARATAAESKIHIPTTG